MNAIESVRSEARRAMNEVEEAMRRKKVMSNVVASSYSRGIDK